MRTRHSLCGYCGTPLTRKQVQLCYRNCSMACNIAARKYAVWSPERTALLVRRWDQGVTAGQIARELRMVTRCAVIGKVRRLALKGRGTMVRNPKRIAAFNQPSMPLGFKPSTVQEPIRDRPMFLPKPLPMPPELPAPESSKSFMEVTQRECHFSYGDPRDLVTFRYCGRPGFPWCSDHVHGKTSEDINVPNVPGVFMWGPR